MANKLSRNVIKTIVKECLVEILAEGIVGSGTKKRSTTKKSILNNMLKENASPGVSSTPSPDRIRKKHTNRKLKGGGR